MSTSGPNYPGTGADETSVGTVVWSSTGNITTDNGTFARGRNTGGSSLTTHYLKATNFGFSIPSGATIDGITVEIKRSGVNLTGAYPADFPSDNSIKIVKGGTISGTDKSSGATWANSTLTYDTFGSSSDLWGTSWTDTDINSGTFGVVCSCIIKSPAVTVSDAQVDTFRITINYTSGGSSFIARSAIIAKQAVNRSSTY